MRLDKTVTIPNFTEIEVEIDTDEILEDMDMDSIVDYAVTNYGNTHVLRYMQHNLDFSDAEIEEAVGQKFEKDETPSEVLAAMNDEDIIEYYHESIKQGLTMSFDDVLKFITDKADGTQVIEMHVLMLNKLLGLKGVPNGSI